MLCTHLREKALSNRNSLAVSVRLVTVKALEQVASQYLCLLHTSHTPLEGLLEKTKSILKGSVGWTSTELQCPKRLWKPCGC